MLQNWDLIVKVFEKGFDLCITLGNIYQHMSADQPVRTEERSHLLPFGAEKGSFVIPLVIPDSFLKQSLGLHHIPWLGRRFTTLQVRHSILVALGCLVTVIVRQARVSHPGGLHSSGSLPVSWLSITFCYFSVSILALNRKITEI